MEFNLQPVSVIIVNYNAGALLIECVETALAQAKQVIVVDNDSTDSSMEMLAKQFPSQIRLVMHFAGQNLGFAAGCNLGLGLAIHSHYLFLNPDCILGPNSLRRMVEVLDSDPKIGMVGGLLTNLDGSEQGGGRRAVPTPWRSFVRAFGLVRLSSRWPKLFYDFHLHKQPLPETPIEVEAISGALMLISKEAMEDVGLWDEAYFMHCEDLDWCMRLRKRGWKILFVPDAPVLHYRGHCSRDKPIFVEWHKHKGMVRFYNKFFRHQYPGGVMWLVNTGVWLRFGAVVAYHSAKDMKVKLQGARFKIKEIRSKVPKARFKVQDRRLMRQDRRDKIRATRSVDWYERRLSGHERRVDGQVLVAVKNNLENSYTGLIGASSFVGGCAIPLLVSDGHHVFAFSRRSSDFKSEAGVTWLQLSVPSFPHAEVSQIKEWICVAPIWALPEYFSMIEAYGARRVVVLSSTSRFTKEGSSDAAENALSIQLTEGEEILKIWAESKGIEWVILRPTLIYGLGQDKNINVIAHFVRRFGFFPLLGRAMGLRQPIHVEDVAIACISAMESPKAANCAYNISGAEILSYKEMVERVFIVTQRRPRLVMVSLVAFRMAVWCLRILPRYRHVSAAMVERMNRDQVFDHASATRDFGFSPRPFQLSEEDVVSSK